MHTMALHLRMRKSSYISRLAADLMFPAKYIHESPYNWALNIPCAAPEWGWPLGSPLAPLIYVNGLILLTSRHPSFHHSHSHLNCIDVIFGETEYLTPHWVLGLPPQGHLCSISLPSLLSQGKYSIHMEGCFISLLQLILSYITWLILPLIFHAACSWRNEGLLRQRGDGPIIKCPLWTNKQQPPQSNMNKKRGRKWSILENLFGCVSE